MDQNIQQIIEQAPEIIATYSIKIILALAVYIVGKWATTMITNLMAKGMNARGVDPTIGKFAKNIVYYAMLTMVVVAALGQLGIQTASFVAIIGAAGLAVGFALQGSLANFASGVLIIIFRPFKIGDFIEAGGAMGSVKEISIFSTILLTGDNKTIIMSNSSVMGGNITNFSAQSERRVDFTVGVGYESNLETVRSELLAIAKAEPRILPEKDVTIGLAQLGDSSLNFTFRVWVKSENYWGVFFDTNEAIKKRFDEVGINIPFPQMDVHLKKADCKA